MARKIDNELRTMLKEEADEMKRRHRVESTSLIGRWLQEADGDEDDEGESLEDIEKDIDSIDTDDDEDNDNDNEKDNKDKDDDDDDKEDDEYVEFGSDDSDIQNEYDENELNTLNDLIADEQHAMQQYFKAGKETKSVILSRLYSDIGAEEAFHSEQLLYAKAEITGEKYEPSDPEVKKEYEELLENGMDEETAMYTVADKHKLDGNHDEEDIEELEDIEKDIEALGESFVQVMHGYELLLAVQESAAYKNNKDLRTVYNEYYTTATENTLFQEAVDNISTKKGSEILGTDNPFLIIGRGIKSVYMFIINLVKKTKNWINKRRVKSKRVQEWIKKHGIKGLFASGVKLYFWNDNTGTVDVSDAVAFMNLCINVNGYIAKAVGVNGPIIPKLKADGSFLSNLKSKTVAFTNISDGRSKIEGTVFTKSKIIVTDQNASDLETMFFGITTNDFIASKNDSDEYTVRSKNVYNALNYISEWAANMLKATDEWMNNVMIPAAGRQKGIAYTKPEVYNECVKTMKVITKAYTNLSKCLASDISACMKLDQGLLNAVNNVDNQRVNTDGSNPGKKININSRDNSEVLDSNGKIRAADKLH